MNFSNDPGTAFTVGVFLGLAVGIVLTWAYYEHKDWERTHNTLPPPQTGTRK